MHYVVLIMATDQSVRCLPNCMASYDLIMIISLILTCYDGVRRQ